MKNTEAPKCVCGNTKNENGNCDGSHAKNQNIMGEWALEIAFHWPHDRLALGWEFMRPNEEYNYTTVKLYLFFVTFTLDI